MYCNQCGTKVTDDSKFCGSCGCQLNATEGNKTNEGNNLASSQHKIKTESIFPISKGLMTLYLSWWSLAALTFLIIIWVENELLPALFVLPIYLAIPLIAYTIYHKKSKKKEKNTYQEKIVTQIQNPQREVVSDKCGISLMEFAKEFGKMQVCKTANKKGEIKSKCLFTKVTEVQFSDSIGELTASEISENKENLVVIKTTVGQYELTLKHGSTLHKIFNSELPPPIDKISE